MPGNGQHWRERAREARAKADQLKENHRSKRRLLGLADFYESLAERIDQHAWKRPRSVIRIQKPL
jgi:hypothetical protein